MWQNEQKFSQYICGRLKKANMNPYRIETGSTSIGVPDLYVPPYWIELKNIRSASVEDSEWTVPWRPGQLKTMKEFRQVIKGGNVYSKLLCPITLVGMKDGVVAIVMANKNSNIIKATDPFVYRFPMKEFSRLTLNKWIREHAYILIGFIDGNYIGTIANSLMAGYCEDIFAPGEYIDWPTAAEYLSSYGLDVMGHYRPEHYELLSDIVQREAESVCQSYFENERRSK